MEWVGTIASWIVFAILLAPVAMLLLTCFVLVPLAHLNPPAATLSRTRFFCPFSRKDVNVTFLNRPGEAVPADVAACSRFAHPEDVRCEKNCLAMMEAREVPSPMVARFALLADGAAHRTAR